MRNRRILILDDDSDYRNLLLTYLKGKFESVELVEYDPVSQGIPDPDYRWSDCDVLILDYDLRSDEATGLDILQRNRDNPDFPATIMLTGAGSEEVAVTALKAGVVDYFRKDKINKEMLQDSVRHALARQELRQERMYTMTEAQSAAKAEARKLITAYKTKYDSLHKAQMDKLLAEKARLEQELKDSKKLFEQLGKMMHGSDQAHANPPVRERTGGPGQIKIKIPGENTLEEKKWALEPMEKKLDYARQQQENAEANLQKVKWKIRQEDDSQNHLAEDIAVFRQESSRRQVASVQPSMEKVKRAQAIAAETAKQKLAEKKREKGMMDDIVSQLKKD